MKTQTEAIQVQAQAIQEQIFDNYKKKLEKLDKLGSTGEELRQSIQEERLLTEIAILTDKADIEEEINMPLLRI